MKVQLTNEKIFTIVYVLKTKYPDLEKFDKRFNFAITRTLANLQPIAAEIIKARDSVIPKFKEFEQKKQDIIKKYSNGVDQDGNPKFESDELRNICQNEVIQLVDEYKETLDERKKEVDIYNEILEEEVEVEVIQCRFEALPNDFDFKNLRILVKETDEEIEALL